MTVKKLTAIENGKLVPTDLSMDADLIEISKVEGNALEVKEDGLYYKESIVVDGDSALNVVSGKLTVVVSPVGDNILQKTTEGLYVPTQGNPHNITTTDINEGTNLFFTESRVNQTVLTGLDTSTATPVLDTDQILAAIGKLQAQINNISSGGGTAFYPSFAGNAGKVLTVNATEDGVEWTTISNGGEDDSGDDEPISSTVEPMLVTPAYFNISISSASDLEIDWGDGTIQTVKSRDDITNENLGLIANQYSHTYTDSYEDKTISIKHLDGKSPIQFFSSDAIKTVQRWYSEGYQPFKLFNDSIGFNQDITFYGLGSQLETVPNIAPPKTTALSGMLIGATSFNQDISSWNVSNVTNLAYTFAQTSAFNQPLDNWDVSNVTNMSSMFSYATAFNQDISGWDVSNVTDMGSMFESATAFDQPLNSWDVSNVVDMSYMFRNATAFNQDLSSWCVTNITSLPQGFDNGTTSWSLPRPVWGTCPEKPEVEEIPSNEIHFTTTEGIINYYGVEGDQIVLNGGNTFTTDTSGEMYDIAVPSGKHKIILAETREHGYVSIGGEALVEIHNFPTLSSVSGFDMDSSPNLVKVPTVLPSNLTSTGWMFSGATSFNQDISMWDTSNVTDMSGMFYEASSFNQDISSWDVSNVIYMSSMFESTTAFNQSLDNWDVSNVANMSYMFSSAITFNQDISMWDVSSVNNMTQMFYNATAFNQDLSQWYVSNITSPPFAFDQEATNWTLPRPVWDTSPNGETPPSSCNGATPAAVLTGYNVLDMTQPPTVDVYVQNILVAENVGATWLNQNWFTNQALIENSNLLGYSVYGTSSNTELFQYYGDGNITFRFVPKTDGFYNGQVYSAKDALQIHYSNYNPTVYKDPSTGEVTFCIGGTN